MLPVSDQIGSRITRKLPASTSYDRLIVDKLRKLGEVPSPACTDSEFLRRVSLDLAGTLPNPGEIEAFLADKSPSKRAKAIDRLLEHSGVCGMVDDAALRPDRQQRAAAEHQFFQRQESRQWYEWIYRRVAENVPYDQLMAGLVLAKGREKPDQSYTDYCREMGSYFRARSMPADFTARKTMPYYLSRRNVRKPEEKALSFSYAMLGVRLECSQCHKHPFDQWTQQDFRQFQAFFQPVDFGVAPSARAKRPRQLREEAGIDKTGGRHEPQGALEKVHMRIGTISRSRSRNCMWPRRSPEFASAATQEPANLPPSCRRRSRRHAAQRDAQAAWRRGSFAGRLPRSARQAHGVAAAERQSVFRPGVGQSGLGGIFRRGHRRAAGRYEPGQSAQQSAACWTPWPGTLWTTTTT